MGRLFQRHEIRKSFSLDGLWNICFDEQNVGEMEKWYETFPARAETTCVPGCWQMSFGKFDKNGTVWYQKDFFVSSQHVQLVFEAVNNECDVYIDGKHVLYHYGAFTEFSKVIPDLGVGRHSMVLRVTNSHNDVDTIPLTYCDWLPFGGIIRSIEVQELGDVFIRNVQIDYDLDVADQSAVLKADVVLENLAGVKSAGTSPFGRLCLYVEDKLMAVQEISDAVPGHINAAFSDLRLEQIALWGIYRPNLYTVRITWEQDGICRDDLVERIGFRTIQAQGKDILLNGEKIILKGINRHEQHPEWGFSMPEHLIKKDIDIIRDMGCNAVRGAHYPHNKWTLDYLDSVGLLFWEEIPMWGFQGPAMESQLVLERSKEMMKEMIHRDYHHPCIIFWGLFNEIDTRIPASRIICSTLAQTVKSLDGKHRLISYATMYDCDDICFDLVDVISLNKYYGWFINGEPLEHWEVFLEKFKNFLKEKDLFDKPFIMSEYGAGAIYGERQMEEVKWTENFQAKYIAYTTDLFMKDPDICGTFPWQFCDSRTGGALTMNRPRGFNNKGLVNEYRKPKMAYEELKRRYTK